MQAWRNWYTRKVEGLVAAMSSGFDSRRLHLQYEFVGGMLMPGGRGRPRRACTMCKWYKYLGNSKDRRTHTEQKAPTVRSELKHMRSW